MSRHTVRVGSGALERADRLVARSIAGLSRRGVQRLLDEGRITIDGRRVRKGEVIRGEREIAIEVHDEDASDLAAEDEPSLAVLFADADCVAVDKPAGRPGHALRAGERGTVANFLAARFPECVAAGGSPLEAGLVHRLDTDTSGVLLAARTPPAWRALREQFGGERVGKSYLAVVRGRVDAPGEIRRAIESDRRSRRRVHVLDGPEPRARGQAAVTRFRPRSQTVAATLLEVEIATGVRHQIRAHLAAIGHPVVGDTLYGGGSDAADRQLLHARLLSFDHPRSGERVTVTSPLPEDFRQALDRLGLDAR